MTQLLTAVSRTDVTTALTDAIARHTLIACHVSASPFLVSWVSYRTALGPIVRLTFYPETPC